MVSAGPAFELRGEKDRDKKVIQRKGVNGAKGVKGVEAV